MAPQYNGNRIEEADMKRLWIVALALLIPATQGNARPDCDALACDEIKQAIREIEARMRAGYTRAQGERYEARLRRLKQKRRRLCR